MINTLLEHVPIKMEVNDVEDVADNKVVKDKTALDVAKDDENVLETDSDEELDDEDDEDDEDEEETDLESEALEIEQAATLLISSDEEAELEAQRIRFPDILVAKKTRKEDSPKNSRSSSRNSSCSNSSSSTVPSSKPLAQTKPNTTAPKDCIEMQEKKQRISPRNKNVESSSNNNNSNAESAKMVDKYNTLLKSKTENKRVENVDKTKSSAENVNKPHVNIPSTPKCRRGSNNSTCSVASTVASETSETESCGNIYVFNLQEKLIFNCEFCDLKYGDLEHFGRHLHEAHKLFNFDEDPEKENAPRNVRKCMKNATTSCPNVKKEPLQSLDAITADSPTPTPSQPPPTPVALPLSVLAEPLESCGNVFILNHRKLFLVCGYCECKYANLDLFEKHLRQQHRIFEGCQNEVNVVPKIEVKEEVYVITEVIDKPHTVTPQAMVAIPAEIPLDISTNSENEHENVATLEEIAEADKDCNSTQIQLNNAGSISETLPDEKEKKSSSEAEHLESLAESSSIDKQNKCRKRSSIVKELPSPIKRPRRNTRNATKANEVNTSSNNYEDQPTIYSTKEAQETLKSASTNPILSIEEKTSENSKLNDTKEVRKTRSAETKKSAQKEPVESKKSIKEKPKKDEKLNQAVNKETQKTVKSLEKRSIENNSTEIKIGPKKINGDSKIVKEKEPITNKNSTEIVSMDIQAPVTNESKESKKPVKEVQETNTTKTQARRSTAKRKSVENNRKTDDIGLEVNQEVAQTAVAIVNSSLEAEKEKAVVDVEPSCKAKKRRRILKTKLEKEPSPAPQILSPPILSPTPPPQVKHLQVHQLPKELMRYDKNIMHDINNDPVNDIEQIQNESLQNEQNEPANIGETNIVTFTISAVKEPLSNLANVAHKADENMSSIKTPVSDLNSPEDVKILVVDNDKRFICDQCPRFFNEHVRLVEHKRLHTGENPFVCDECGKKFRIRMRLNEHKLRHSKEKKFKCEICQLACCTKQDLNLHMRHHTIDRRSKTYKYEHCEKKFISNIDRKVTNESKESKKPVKEVQETKTTKTQARKSTAKRKSVGNNRKTDDIGLEVNQEVAQTAVIIVNSSSEAEKDKAVVDVEPSCKAKKRRRILKTKLEKEPSPAPQILSPPILSPTPPPQVEHLQVHQLPKELMRYDENIMHDINNDPVNDIIEQIQNEFLQNEQNEPANIGETNIVTFTINAVNEPLSNLANVAQKEDEKMSLSIKTPVSDLNSPEDVKILVVDNVKRFICDQCPRFFKKHVRLVEHKRLHTGEKPFACDECGKKFRIRMRLNEHKLRHSKEKKFKCEICQLACCTKQDLNLHMRHHTNDRRFQCTMCPKAFVRSSDLKIHVRVHTGEKPYVCEICNKCFRANQNLIVHKKSHMGEASKTYKCEHCEKKFMRKIDRKVHMRSHTGEKPYKCEICERGYSSKFNVRAHIERDHISANGVGTPPRGKKKPGPKPKALREELAKQKKLIEELQQQLLEQIKTDEKIITSEEKIPMVDTIQDCPITRSAQVKSSSSSSSNDPVQSAYELLNQLKNNTTTSKPLTIIPSPPPTVMAGPDVFSKAKKSPTTLLPLTITQKIEQHSPASTTPSAASVSCLTTPSPPKTTATKVVSQKTSLGIQQVSVTVSMQVENVTQNPTTSEKENAGLLTTTTSQSTSVKKERKITSYFTVLGQKTEV